MLTGIGFILVGILCIWFGSLLLDEPKATPVTHNWDFENLDANEPVQSDVMVKSFWNYIGWGTVMIGVLSIAGGLIGLFSLAY